MSTGGVAAGRVARVAERDGCAGNRLAGLRAGHDAGELRFEIRIGDRRGGRNRSGRGQSEGRGRGRRAAAAGQDGDWYQEHESPHRRHASSGERAAPFPKSSGRVPRRSAAYLTVKKVLVDGLGLLRNRARTETFLLCPLTRLLGTRYLMLAKPF